MTPRLDAATRRLALESFYPSAAAAETAAAAALARPDPALEDARRRGVEEGRRLGVEEGRQAARDGLAAEIEAAVDAARSEERAAASDRAVEALRAAAQSVAELRAAQADRAEEAVRRAAASAIGAIAPRLAADGLAAETARSLAARFGAVMRQGRAKLRVPSADFEAVRATLSAKAGLAEGWEVVADASLGPGEAEAEWPDGAARLDLASAAEAVLAAALKSFGPAVAPELTSDNPASDDAGDGKMETDE